MTIPYVTGTVSVTAGNAIVTGVGTGWQTAGLVAGVFGLDSANGNPVPVLSVDSDTQITLAKPWRGTTASGQAYWITYDTTAGQQTVSNAQRLAEYIARLDKPALAALASLTPAADKLPYFGPGGAGALADFNAAARALLAGTGSINDAQTPDGLRADKTITDANAFTARGWARGNNIANAPTNTGDGDWYIYRNDILSGFGRQWAYSFFTGRVFQRRYTSSGFSGWVRDDAPERGSTANGEYVRFADGTQICFRQFDTSTTAISTADGQLFRSPNLTWFFPAQFSSNPSFSAASTIGIDKPTGVGAGTVNTGAASFSIWSSTSLGAGSITSARLTAIGRWF